MPLDLAALEQAITSQHQQQPFSGVISIRERGELRLARAFGLANRSAGIANTVETRFGMASGAKTFTALAICQLVDQGRLTFDTRLCDCLPIPFPTFDPAVTIHQLLCHSSGIPDYFDEEGDSDYEAIWRERPMYSFLSPRDFLPLFTNLAMKFHPGERWSYNNAAYIVLGLVVEAVSGMSFPEYITGHIFRPSGMVDSGYFRLDCLPERTALGYLADASLGWRSNIYSIPILGGPDGGAFTSAGDLSRFWEALQSGRLVSRGIYEKMIQPYWPTEEGSQEYWYGYGLWLSGEKDHLRAISMLGEDPGVAFLSTVYPDQEIEFSLLGNQVPETWAMNQQIRAILRAA